MLDVQLCRVFSTCLDEFWHSFASFELLYLLRVSNVPGRCEKFAFLEQRFSTDTAHKGSREAYGNLVSVVMASCCVSVKLGEQTAHDPRSVEAKICRCVDQRFRG